jgi:hypothetical protein
MQRVLACQRLASVMGSKPLRCLARLCGWNEPEQVKHDHVHIQVDSALIQQLRAGYAQLSERSANTRLPGGARVPVEEAMSSRQQASG